MPGPADFCYNPLLKDIYLTYFFLLHAESVLVGGIKNEVWTIKILWEMSRFVKLCGSKFLIGRVEVLGKVEIISFELRKWSKKCIKRKIKSFSNIIYWSQIWISFVHWEISNFNFVFKSQNGFERILKKLLFLSIIL